MIEGDLADTGLADVLGELAEGGATGCLTLIDPTRGAAAVHLRQGRPYAAELPGAPDQPVGTALAVLLGWERGTWHFRLRPGPADTPVDTPADTPVDTAVDTAALLRELSALSAEDEPDQPVRTAPRAPVAPRRRGLFGRG